jgi:hypothetical protein
MTMGALQSCRFRVQPAGLFRRDRPQGGRNSSFGNPNQQADTDKSRKCGPSLIERGLTETARAGYQEPAV